MTRLYEYLTKLENKHTAVLSIHYNHKW